MVGLNRIAPKKPVNATFRPPSSTVKPRSAAGMKWKPDAIPGVSGAKRVRPAEGGKGDRSGPATFLNPFESARAFEPEMSIEESEALTRQMQQRRLGWHRTEEEAMDHEEALDDDSDAYIDPVLRAEGRQPAFNRQCNPTPVEDEESSLPPSSPLAAPRYTIQARGLVSAPTPRSGQTGAGGFRTPATLPLRRPGFSTRTEISQRSALSNLHQQPAPTHLNSRPGASSVAFSDKLAHIDTLVSNLRTKIEQLELASNKCTDHEQRIQHLTNENAALQTIVEEHRTVISDLHVTVEAQGASMQELISMMDDLQNSNTAVPTMKSVDKATKAVRDNVFNNAIRRSFLHAMGISDSKQALLFEAVEDGAFWFECPTRDANLLHPNFVGSWSDNAEWRNDMICYIREKACEVYPQLHADRLAQKTDTDIVRQLREVFENTKEVVKKGAKGAEMVVAKKIKQRQTARKGRKNTERSAVDVRRDTGTDGPEWDWFFQVCYQSTDESDIGGGNSSRPTVEFESDTEMAPQTTYRDEQVNDKVLLMDAAVSKRKAERGGRNFSVPITRGEPRDKDLPRPGNKKLKISRAFISTDWLAANPNMDAPSRVTPWQEDDQKNGGLEAAHGNDAAYDGEDDGEAEEGIEDQEPIPGTNDEDMDSKLTA